MTHSVHIPSGATNDSTWLALLDAMVDAVVVVDAQGCIEIVNRAGLKMFGYAEDELLGQNVSVLMPEPYRSQHDGYMRHYMTTGEAKIIGIGREVKGVTNGGDVFPVHLSVGVVHGGQEQRFVGIVRNITKSQADAMELENTKALLRKVIDEVPVMMHAKDASNRYVFVNQALADAYETTVDDLVGRYQREFHPVADEVAAFIEDDREVITTKRPMRISERKFTFVNGEEHFVESTKMPIEFEGAGETYVLTINVDITERLHLQQMIANNERTLRQTIENAPAPIITLDTDGRIESANPRACRMLGAEKHQLIGASLQDFVEPHDRAEFARLLKDIVKRGDAPSQPDVTETVKGNIKFMTNNQGIKEARYNIGLVRREDRLVSSLVVELEDLADRIRAEQWEKERRDRIAHGDRLNLLGEMAAGIAHEINQPLTVIAARTNAARRRLSSGVADLDKLADTLDRINAQAHRAGEVIRRLRTLAKRDLGQAEYVDLNAVISDVLSLAKIDARLQGVRLDIRLADQPQMVYIDAVQIQQVVLNLVRNAIDATIAADNTAHPVELRVHHQPEPSDAAALGAAPIVNHGDSDVDRRVVVVDVIDRGAGVPEDVKDHLFEAFFTTKESGMGMGLSVSQSIIASHDGRLEYRKNTLGGAIFSMILPLSERRSTPS